MEFNEMIRDCDMTSKAVLSNYDEKIYKNYGLLAYNFKTVDKYKYANENFRGDLDVRIIKEKDMTDFLEVQNQMIQITKIMIGSEAIDSTYEMFTNMSREDVQYIKGKKQNFDISHEETKNKNEYINEIDTSFIEGISGDYRTIGYLERKNLPSRIIFKSHFVSPNIIDEIAVNEYILGTFKSRVATSKRSYDFFDKKRESYFKIGEVEYILSGKCSEQEAIDQVYKKIIAIRVVANGAHIINSKSKMSKIDAFATGVMVLLEIPESITKASVISAWSYIESKEDMNNLLNGEEIPVYKISDDSWETGIFGGSEKKITNVKKKAKNMSIGEVYGNYNDYLRVLLLSIGEDQKMRRVMDLIYLDYKFIYGEEIKVWDYGLSHTITAYSDDDDFSYKITEGYHR
jgi:hypothetical protein